MIQNGEWPGPAMLTNMPSPTPTKNLAKAFWIKIYNIVTWGRKNKNEMAKQRKNYNTVAN